MRMVQDVNAKFEKTSTNSTDGAADTKGRRTTHDAAIYEQQVAVGTVNLVSRFASADACDSHDSMLPFEHHDAFDNKQSYNVDFSTVLAGGPAKRAIPFAGGEINFAKTPTRPITITQWEAVSRQFGKSCWNT